MATPKPIPDVRLKSANVMRNPRYAQQVIDRLNVVANSTVRIGAGPSQMSVAPEGSLIHVSIDEIISQLQARKLI